MSIDDIEGARPSQLINVEDKKNRNHNCLDYQDVTKQKKKHVRRFSTNPLNPSYEGQSLLNNSPLSKSQMIPKGMFKMATEGAAPPDCSQKLLSKAHEE